MISHFEFVLGEARGRWITILGDDDGLLPFFFERLEEMEIDKLAANALVFRRAYYTWDGCQELQGANVLYYSYLPSRSYVSNFLSIFLCVISFKDYMSLPQLYTTGIIKKEHIDFIKNRAGGRFFFGNTHDAASAAVLASNSSKHCRVEEPLFWTGTSNKSVGFSQESKSHKEKSLEFDALNAEDDYACTFKLPPIIDMIFDLNIIFYKALRSCPNAGSLWTSRSMYYIFLAGLCVKDKNFRDLIEKSSDLDIRPWNLRFCIFILSLLKKIYNPDSIERKRSQSIHHIYSTDRFEYPTMREASLAVSHLYRNSISKKTALDTASSS